MSSPNPFFAQQQRLADLLEAHAYFAGMTAQRLLLTEQVGDLETAVSQSIINGSGWGVVVSTAEGRGSVSSYEALRTAEELNISIVHNPSVDPAHNALDAQWAAIQAVHGQLAYALGDNLGAPREEDFFRVVGHQRRMDGPPGFNVRELHVQAGLRLR